MKNKISAEVIKDLTERKNRSREYLRSLSPLEKVEKLVELQERQYQLLEIREAAGGRPIPEKWRKWRKARDEFSANK